MKKNIKVEIILNFDVSNNGEKLSEINPILSDEYFNVWTEITVLYISFGLQFILSLKRRSCCVLVTLHISNYTRLLRK